MKLEEMLQKVQKDTLNWLRIGFGVLTLTEEQLEQKYKLISKLLIEEFEEYELAVKENNRAEQLNAISDLLFVANNIPFFVNKPMEVTTSCVQFYSASYVFKHEYRNYGLVLNVINSIIKSSGFSIYDIFVENERVYKSNMTKFCKTEEESKLSVEMYRNGTHPNKLGEIIECEYFSTGNSEFPYRLQTPSGKIMKSHLFLDVEHFRN